MFSGVTASFVAYPLDTVRRQLILDGSEGYQSKYGGKIRSAIRILYLEGGVSRFYRGCAVNMVKAAPSVSLTLVLTDVLRTWME